MTSRKQKTLNWAFDHALSHSLLTRQRLDTNKTFQNIKEELPSLNLHLKPYFSNWNPVFFMDGVNSNLLNERGQWTVRDGLCPLLVALDELSIEDISKSLYIDQDFIEFIPTNWQKKVQSYEVISHHVFDFKNPPGMLFLSGDLSPELISESEIQSQLDLLTDLWGSRLHHIPIQSFFTGSEAHFERLDWIQQRLKRKIQNLSWEKVLDLENLKSFAFHEFNNKCFYADSFVKHWILSRGGGLISFSKKSPLQGSLHPLSLYHSLQVFESNPQPF